jgi:hypothetical protein
LVEGVAVTKPRANRLSDEIKKLEAYGLKVTTGTEPGSVTLIFYGIRPGTKLKENEPNAISPAAVESAVYNGSASSGSKPCATGRFTFWRATGAS